MGWVLFWGPGWLRQCGSGWGLATENPRAGAEPPRLPQGWLPAAGPSLPVGSLLAVATGRPPGPTEAAPRLIPRGAGEVSSSLWCRRRGPRPSPRAPRGCAGAMGQGAQPTRAPGDLPRQSHWPIRSWRDLSQYRYQPIGIQRSAAAELLANQRSERSATAEQPSSQCWERPVVAEPLASWICMAELPANRCQGIAPRLSCRPISTEEISRSPAAGQSLMAAQGCPTPGPAVPGWPWPLCP